MVTGAKTQGNCVRVAMCGQAAVATTPVDRFARLAQASGTAKEQLRSGYLALQLGCI